MSIWHIVMDSFHYSTSNWIKVIFLGLVIFIADMINELSFLGVSAAKIDLFLILIGLILAIFESGYVFRIIEESTHGSEVLPSFDRFWETSVHGIKEIFITLIYFIVPSLLILVGVVEVNELIGHFSQEVDFFLILSGLILASFLYIPYQVAVLNMAHHHGTLRSGFDFKSIFQKVRKMGFKNLIFVYLLNVFFVTVVVYTLSDTLAILPYIGDLISGLFIAPMILIFTARVLGLINRDLVV